MKLKLRKTHPLEWLLEGFEEKSDFRRRKMFGCEAAYLGEKLVLVLADGKEPWNGMMVPAEKDQQPSLIAQWPVLSPHPILGKWLYLSVADSSFEEIALSVVERIRRGDPRFGTVPVPKKKPAAKRPRKGPTPIAKARNLGPKSAAQLEAVGVGTLEDLLRIGWEKVFRKLVRKDRRALNLNYAYALAGAVEGCDWRELPASLKKKVMAVVEALR